MLRAVLNKSWRQHPTRLQLYGHLPPITKTIQVRRTRHAGHCWRSKDELISDVLLWTPTHGCARVGRPARTYIQQLCEDTGCNPEDLPEAMNDREKWRETVRDIRAGGATWWWWWFLFATVTVLLYSCIKWNLIKHLKKKGNYISTLSAVFNNSWMRHPKLYDYFYCSINFIIYYFLKIHICSIQVIANMTRLWNLVCYGKFWWYRKQPSVKIHHLYYIYIYIYIYICLAPIKIFVQALRYKSWWWSYTITNPGSSTLQNTSCTATYLSSHKPSK